MTSIKKFVAIGPESTGKSTLCQELANFHNTLWCEEYAREYLITNGNDYTYKDLLTIARGQITLENAITQKAELSGKNLIFIDTDMYVMKVWCEFVFDHCHPYILNQIAERKYDGYLLCHPDLPWENDPLREYPDQETRDQLFKIYKELLSQQSTPWCHIIGDYDERISRANQFINTLESGD